jgi:hypothetical protein
MIFNINVKITDILPVNSDGQTLEDAINDVKYGFKSRTTGNVLLYKENDKYGIGDGFHRIAECILNNQTHIMADISL